MKIILVLTIIYGIIPLLLFYVYNRKSLDLSSIYSFLVVVFIASIYELIGSVILKMSFENWYLIYKTLAFFSLHYFFYSLLKKRYGIVFLIYIVLFILLLVLAHTFWSGFNVLDVNAYFNMFQMLVVLNFSIYWFKGLFLELVEENLFGNPNFYFISGLIIYYCGTLFLFLVSSSIYAIDKSNFQFYWLLNILLNFVLRSLLIIGIWKARVK